MIRKILFFFLFLFLISNGEIVLKDFRKEGDIKIKGGRFYNEKGGKIFSKFIIDEDGTYFLEFKGKIPEDIENKGIQYLVELNGKPILHKQGWDEGYIPTVIPVKKYSNGYYNLIYTVPLDLKKGGNSLTLNLPERTSVYSLKLLEKIEGNIKKEVESSPDQFIFYKKEKQPISFFLTSDIDKNLNGLVISYFTILVDDKGEGSWSPGLRFTAVEILDKKEIFIKTKKGEKKKIKIEVPFNKYGTISVFLILKDKDKILPLHLLNYSIVFERNTDEFNYDGLFILSHNRPDISLKTIKKIGIDWVRYEVGWDGFEPEKGKFKWEQIDKFMNSCRENKIYVMTLTEGAPDWAKPKGDFFDIPYKDFKIKLDWSPGREYYNDWKNAWIEYGKRYKDVNRAFNVWNEPWEGGGISGWKSTGEHYRNLFKKIREARDEIDPEIKIVGADSSHNTNWKIFAAGMEKDIDVLSTHYELPVQASYSSSLANYYGKEVWDTETWVSWMGDSATLRNLLCEIALGWKKVSPHLTSLMFDKTGFPNTSVGWTSAMARFLNNKEYKGFAHPERPPFVLLFKGVNENVAVVTTLCGIYEWQKNVFWGQFFNDNPIMIIKNIPDIEVFDIYGNKVNIQKKRREILIPVNKNPKYIVSKMDFDNFKKILSEAIYKELKPVEIKVHQITEILEDKPELIVELKNTYPVPISGKIKIRCENLKFENNEIKFKLDPIEKRDFSFKIVSGDISSNNFPAEIIVNTDKGSANLKENLVFCVIKKGKIIVDGKLDDWKEIKAIPIIVSKEEENVNFLLKAWYPWEKFIEQGTDFMAEVSFAYDNNYFYGMARVKDKTKDILPSLLTGKNLHKFQNPPGDYVYAEAGPIPGATGDMIKLSFGPVDKKIWIKKYEVFSPDSPLYRFGHYISALYQYLIYPTQEGNGEIMRVMTPNFYYLHPLPIDYKFLSEKCKVEDSKIFIQRKENGYIYEFAIPWKELSEITPEKNKKIRLSFQIQDKNMGNVLEFSKDKSICSVNTLDFEPGWGTKWTCETEFGFSQ